MRHKRLLFQATQPTMIGMTDTTHTAHGTGLDSRAEALHWLAARVRWERLLDELRDEPADAADTSIELDERAA